MRCFVAVTPGASITDGMAAELGRLRADAEQSGLKASWSRPEGWHATVKFLNEIGGEQIDEVARALARVAAAQAPFRIEATGLLTLPERARTPNVLAVALADDGGFGAFARRLDEAVAACGFERERRAFRPHVTLARIRAPRGWREFRPSVERLRTHCFGAGEIDAVTLFSSKLGAGPARYEALAAFRFGANDEYATPGRHAGARH